MSKLSLLEEIEKCRKQDGGPFFNKKENQRLKYQQEKFRKEEEGRISNDKISSSSRSNNGQEEVEVI